MGDLNSSGLYIDLAPFGRIILDGVQRLYYFGSDPIPRAGPKFSGFATKNDTKFLEVWPGKDVTSVKMWPEDMMNLDFTIDYIPPAT